MKNRVCPKTEHDDRISHRIHNIILRRVKRLSDVPLLRRLGVSCPKNHNPADFFIQLLAIVPSQELCSFETIDTVCEAYESSQYKNDMMQHQKQLSIAGRVSALNTDSPNRPCMRLGH